MAEGQYTGQKASYIYVSDNLTSYAIYRDTDLALTALTGLEAYTVGAPFASPFPTGFKPRGVYWLGYIGQRAVRKFLICGTVDSPLYANDSSQAVTIDGVVGFTVSRRGEKLRVIRRTLQIVVPPVP
jgi:hypothetical protein